MRGRPSPIVLTATLGLACTKPNPLFGDESTTATTTAPATSDPTTGAATADLSLGTGTPTTGESSATSEAITGSGTTSGTSTGHESTTTTGTTGDDGPPATCAEARDLGMDESGVITLAVPEQPGATIDVWCEQKLAGGGWLLVGRSAPTDTPPAFGWGVATGDVEDDSQPYSLDLLTYKFPSSELLIGNYTQGKQPGGNMYQLSAPEGFPFAFAISTGMTSAPQTVLGPCTPDGGPSMLRWIGYTALDDRFRLRDIPENDANDVYGLFATGFHLGGGDCSSAGKLDGTQGMILVR
ncbi:MAG TPA: hypothetical protein VGB85_02400 [Nannocystis sp.]|jgi:hypothetical protein